MGAAAGGTRVREPGQCWVPWPGWARAVSGRQLGSIAMWVTAAAPPPPAPPPCRPARTNPAHRAYATQLRSSRARSGLATWSAQPHAYGVTTQDSGTPPRAQGCTVTEHTLLHAYTLACTHIYTLHTRVHTNSCTQHTHALYHVDICTYFHVHLCTLTCMHIYTCAWMCIYTHKYVYSYICTYTFICTHSRVHINTPACTHLHAHTHANSHLTHMNTHTHPHSFTFTHTLIYTHVHAHR